MENELNYQSLGLKIREVRKFRNLSQEKLSELNKKTLILKLSFRDKNFF